jgi:hypothetical protein
MNRRTVGILGVIATLFLVAVPGFRSASDGGSRQVAEKAQAASTSKSSSSPQSLVSTRAGCNAPENSYRAEMLEALRGRFSSSPAVQSETSSKACPADSIDIPGPQRAYTHVVIALLPDPVHTNLALFFDRQIDALQQGAQDNGWVFDEAKMPWDNKDHPESSDLRLRKLAEASQNRVEQQPGFLIFHHAPNPDGSMSRERLLVFVVGETPTGGVEKQQFRNAVAITRQLFRDPPNSLGEHLHDPLLILGPTFSGSLSSLSQLLDCSHLGSSTALACANNVVILSGTVTDCSSVAAFNSIPGNNLQSLQEFDVNAIDRLLSFAQEHGYKPSHIAILSEDETVYGASFSKPGSGFCSDGARERSVPHVYFPREISQLRNAYQHNLTVQTTADKNQRITLPLDLESSGSDDDTVRQIFAEPVAIVAGIGSAGNCR